MENSTGVTKIESELNSNARIMPKSKFNPADVTAINV